MTTRKNLKKDGVKKRREGSLLRQLELIGGLHRNTVQHIHICIYRPLGGQSFLHASEDIWLRLLCP